MSGLSHSSKNTRGRRARAAAFVADVVEAALERVRELRGAIAAADERADHPDHLQDLGDAALVERHDHVAAPDELGGDVRLQIRERQDEVGPQRFDLVEARVDERRDLRLLTRFRRPHGVARDADDPIAFAKEIQRLGRLFGQTHDARRVASAHGVVIIS